jgi:diguanylate cyclase (GGDEF)-like protein/PAS domain S-box-containing protein
MTAKKPSRKNKMISAPDEQTFRLMFEGHSAIMLLIEPQVGIILDANQAAVDFYGYPKSKLCGMSINEINTLLPGQLEAEHQKAFNEGRNHLVFPNRLANGEERIVEVHSSSIALQEKQVIFSVIHDITARERAEVELQYMKESLKAANIELQAALTREKQLARTDALTGINNRGYLFELAEREFNVAIRYHPPLSIIIFDIDYFKQINDTFGHLTGDQVLQSIAQVVCAKIRSTDLIGRYGGDEFVVLLPQTSEQEALSLAERIHTSVAAIRMENVEDSMTLTVSIGIAQTSHNTIPNLLHDTLLETGRTSQFGTLENLFLRADQALYAAKQAGRNRTVIFTQE